MCVNSIALHKENIKLQSTENKQNISKLPRSSTQIQDVFDSLESDLPFRSGDEYKKMLTFTDNIKEPIHRWYQYKEGYSYRLVNKVLQSYPTPEEYQSVLDPFSGAGTTLIEAQAAGLTAVGIELNPFAALLSSAKAHWQSINIDEVQRTLDVIIQDQISSPIELPALTTFRKEEYFPNGNAYELVKLRDSILQKDLSIHTKNLFLIALASIIEDVSCLHKDGRLLRYKPQAVLVPREAFQKRVLMFIEDLRNKQSDHFADIITIQGDARNLSSILKENGINQKFGLILYSPPYPNNFDYSEVYKCELWLLNLIKSYDEWRKLRLSTFRSHPSCNFPATHHLRNDSKLRKIYSLIELMANCSDIGGYAQSKAPSVIRGYFDDVFCMLKEQYEKLAPGGHIVCIVGNAKHGNLHVPTDTLIAKMGQALGLTLVEIYVAKYRNNRKKGNYKLRESLVVFKKTN